MANEEVLNSDLLRARIVREEYHHLTEKEVRRIYIEETGEEPPSEITVYHSDDLEGFDDEDYGFDGTAIHFYDKEKGINQVYTIPRGTEKKESGTGKPLDYTYDGMGIFVGQNKSHYKKANIKSLPKKSIKKLIIRVKPREYR